MLGFDVLREGDAFFGGEGRFFARDGVEGEEAFGIGDARLLDGFVIGGFSLAVILKGLRLKCLHLALEFGTEALEGGFVVELLLLDEGEVVFQQLRIRVMGDSLVEGSDALNVAAEGIFRIIQSIPSKKSEPVKKWLAEVGAQRVDQMIDPELTFQMAVEDYRRQGYSDRWINERMRSIEMRKELTDEWQRSGIHESRDFAILTDILTKAWSGMTTGEYKRHKGLTKQNLRDNMTNVELALNTLAEVTTTELSRQRNPQGMAQSQETAHEGGEVARNARADIESRLGHTVISSQRASDYLQSGQQTPNALPSSDNEDNK